jgi:hypothetical protein
MRYWAKCKILNINYCHSRHLYYKCIKVLMSVRVYIYCKFLLFQSLISYDDDDDKYVYNSYELNFI